MPDEPRLIRHHLPKTCENCGGDIAAGEWARMVFCEESGTARFHHRVCPGAGATVERPSPRMPGFLKRALGLRGRPAITLATTLA